MSRLCPIHQVQRAALGDLAGIQVAVMGTLEAADVVVVATEHVRRPGQQLQVLRLQEIVLVRP